MTFSSRTDQVPTTVYCFGAGEAGVAKGAAVDGGAAAGRLGLPDACGLGEAVVAAGTLSRMVP